MPQQLSALYVGQLLDQVRGLLRVQHHEHAVAVPRIQSGLTSSDVVAAEVVQERFHLDAGVVIEELREPHPGAILFFETLCHIRFA